MTVTHNAQTFVTVAESKAAELSSPWSSVVFWCKSNWKALLAELVATALLVFLGCMTCIPIDGYDPPPAMYDAFGFGFIVMMNIQIFSPICGAHMNPCITLLAVFWGNMSIVLGIAYFIVQCIGSVFASWLLYTVSPVDMVAGAVCVTQPNATIGLWESVVVEMVLTAVLCFVTCSVWDPVNGMNMDSMPIKFGLTIAGLSLAGGPLTGASMNPARALGPALLAGVWTAHWVYWVGPPLGAILAATLYIFIWLDRKPKNKAEDLDVNT